MLWIIYKKEEKLERKNNMKVIGFVGPKGSGKDTSADLLKSMGKSRGKLSFAGPLKKLCSKVFEIPLATFNDPILKEKPFEEMKRFGKPIILTTSLLRQVKKECPKFLSEYSETDPAQMIYNIDRVPVNGLEGRVFKTPRELLQIIGTQFIRERVYKEWHMRAAFSKTALLECDQSKVYCVTDIRFPNEYEFLKEKFGDAFECYYVERPEAEKVLAKATHESELGVLEIKKLIDKKNILTNDGTVEVLKEKLKKLKTPKASSKPKPGSRLIYGPRT